MLPPAPPAPAPARDGGCGGSLTVGDTLRAPVGDPAHQGGGSASGSGTNRGVVFQQSTPAASTAGATQAPPETTGSVGAMRDVGTGVALRLQHVVSVAVVDGRRLCPATECGNLLVATRTRPARAGAPPRFGFVVLCLVDLQRGALASVSVHKRPITDMAFAGDGAGGGLVLTTSLDASIAFTNIATTQCVLRYSLGPPALSCCWCVAQPRWYLAAGLGSHVVWCAHVWLVRRCRTPHHQVALAGLVDGTVRVLDMRNTRRAAATWRCCRRPIHSLMVVPRPGLYTRPREARAPPRRSLVFAASILGVYAAVWLPPTAAATRSHSAAAAEAAVAADSGVPRPRGSSGGAATSQPGRFVRVWAPSAGCTVTGLRLGSACGALVASCRGSSDSSATAGASASAAGGPPAAAQVLLSIHDLCRVFDGATGALGTTTPAATDTARPATACPAQYVSGHASTCLALRGACLLRCTSERVFSADGSTAVAHSARMVACAHDTTTSVGYWVLRDGGNGTCLKQQAGGGAAAGAQDAPVHVRGSTHCRQLQPAPNGSQLAMPMRTATPAHSDCVLDVVHIAVGLGAHTLAGDGSAAASSATPGSTVQRVQRLVVSVSKTMLMVHRVVVEALPDRQRASTPTGDA